MKKPEKLTQLQRIVALEIALTQAQTKIQELVQHANTHVHSIQPHPARGYWAWISL